MNTGCGVRDKPGRWEAGKVRSWEGEKLGRREGGKVRRWEGEKLGR